MTPAVNNEIIVTPRLIFGAFACLHPFDVTERENLDAVNLDLHVITSAHAESESIDNFDPGYRDTIARSELNSK